MKKIILLFSTLLIVFILNAQKKHIPVTTTHYHQLGDNQITIKSLQYGKNKDIVFINLHDNETTSVAATKKLLQTKGGLLIKLENDNKRNIHFRLDGINYTFDPNRMFSKVGIRQTLKRYKAINNKAIREVEKFATRILKFFPKGVKCVIALHNNKEGGFSVNSYLPGSEYGTDAKKISANESHDPDDFFLTTDSLLFYQLSLEKYNMVWQDKLLVRQDGSLSVYFGEKKICYLNCETQFGKAKKYEEMLAAALKYIEAKRYSSASSE
ncbi:MAG: hypothetical protein ACXWWC_00850 [Chitinophagaceae bacterium]